MAKARGITQDLVKKLEKQRPLSTRGGIRHMLVFINLDGRV